MMEKIITKNKKNLMMNTVRCQHPSKPAQNSQYTKPSTEREEVD